MRLCINPHCKSSDRQNPDTVDFCENCQCELLIDRTYVVKRLLSDNTGFGTIYEVENAKQQPRVLKILRSEFNEQPKTISLFQQEALILGKIDSPGLPKIDGYIHHPLPDNTILHGIVMEKVEGINLYEWITTHKPVSEKIAIAWLRQIMRVLQIVHQNGYFHRDIKPENIMLKPSGKLTLIDFGTAREATYTYLAKIGSLGGITKINSAGYTAPEQSRGFAIPQSDFYSLGMTFIHLATGKHPLDLHDPHTDIYNWRPSAMQLSDDFAQLLERLISPRPVDRPADCAAILHNLDELDRLSKENQTERQNQAKKKIEQQTRNKIWLSFAIVAFLGLTVYALAIFYRLLPSPIPLPTPIVQPK
ncbi:serine/threonine-protein kinase [Tumidithrix helvetica PCC 7403]|uniref:serine/threonine protein kinase n=1 Tax=Tumidithrix helvetica TaxID=3457545 RepID=UPI003C8AE9A9